MLLELMILWTHITQKNKRESRPQNINILCKINIEVYPSSSFVCLIWNQCTHEQEETHMD